MSSRLHKKKLRVMKKLEAARQALLIESMKKEPTKQQKNDVTYVWQHMKKALKGLSVSTVIPLQPPLYPHTKYRLNSKQVEYFSEIIRKWA